MVNGQADTAALQHHPGGAVEFLHSLVVCHRLPGQLAEGLLHSVLSSHHHLSSAAFRLLDQVIRFGQNCSMKTVINYRSDDPHRFRHWPKRSSVDSRWSFELANLLI